MDGTMPLVEAAFTLLYPVASATIVATDARDTNQDAAIAANTAAIATHTTQLSDHEKLIVTLCFLQHISNTNRDAALAWGHTIGLY